MTSLYFERGVAGKKHIPVNWRFSCTRSSNGLEIAMTGLEMCRQLCSVLSPAIETGVVSTTNRDNHSCRDLQHRDSKATIRDTGIYRKDG